MITVFGAPPTRALRVIWMLEEMELPYEVHAVDFATRLACPKVIRPGRFICSSCISARPRSPGR